MKKTPTVLLILDGYGLAPSGENNAIACANTPVMDQLFASCPHTTVQASGLDVGLPAGQMGNSEVGHTNIGAGRVVYQDLPRISNAVADGSFFENAAYKAAMENCLANDKALHVVGLLSDGGVHSHINHWFAMLEMAKKYGVKRVYAHPLLDGRDVGPSTGLGYVKALAEKFEELGNGCIATVQGRFYGMDRDKRWERVEQGYAAMVYGEGVLDPDPVHAVSESYQKGVTDEFVVPTVCCTEGMIASGDSVVFMNFRPDRARELTRAYIFEDFDGFERRNGYFPLTYVSMTQYDKTFEDKLTVAFKPQTLKNTLGEYLAANGKTQLRIAETEKYAHVTFFFNGGVEAPNPLEDRCLIPSPKVPTYDLQPEMSAYLVAEEVVKRIESGKYDVMILNFANPDMVGHTGVMEAAVKAVHAVDECLDKVVTAILKNGGRCLITADHGNCEYMWDYEENAPFTAHTTNPVPCVYVDAAEKDVELREGGRLSDLAPTLLDMVGLPKPVEMTGSTLFKG